MTQKHDVNEEEGENLKPKNERKTEELAEPNNIEDTEK